MTDTEGSERETTAIGEPEEAELADEELERGKPAQAEMPDEDRAAEELEPLEGGAETMADLDEEEDRTNRPGPAERSV
jgi:hypothetical protein